MRGKAPFGTSLAASPAPQPPHLKGAGAWHKDLTGQYPVTCSWEILQDVLDSPAICQKYVCGPPKVNIGSMLSGTEG